MPFEDYANPMGFEVNVDFFEVNVGFE